MDEERLLEQLIADYEVSYGEGSGWQIMGALLRSHGASRIVQVFQKAKGRKIVVEHPEGIIDGVIVKYVSITPNEKT